MSPRTVQVSDDVYDHIATNGRFGETVDDVLRRLFGLAASASSAERPTRKAGPRRPRQATVSMSARIEGDEFVVSFRDGARRVWPLPRQKVGDDVAQLSAEAQSWAEAQGASYGQMKAVHKALTEGGYYNTASRRRAPKVAR